ncbi:transcriptional regulator [Brasilonema octagenarum UFV-E1]|uniref:Transcriptional regulator n=2 Tax=Brasilonema TaxID=383614 RepID=A0A856MHQ6_9CYAN|nr:MULTISPECIES: ATP-binding protein [Brasilonema]NMF65108.1 transcriptional regulator [Brasilonema octagenarum UFV-OR1]QDL08506.1 transcriptional regulator [Brasilonema sennae CENA114]QDL14861.1 transcriptional regulator [Brasilonema octagenarum UFV-E1]
MNDEELEVLLSDLESDRVERKASISDKGKLCDAICAFANDLPNHQKPGVLFIGVNDNGSCANLHIDDKLLLTLSSLRSDGNILPFPSMIVQKRTICRCELAVVIVEPSDAPPVRFNGRVCVRVGPRRATATAEEERRLAEKRRSKDLPFDLRSIAFASLDDLDLDLFRRVYLPSSLAIEVLEENQRSVEQQLTALRFATVEPLLKPTILGVLVIGNDPRQFVPCAYVQFLRIDGSELTDPIKDQKEIGGPLPDLLRMLDETFQAHISVATDITASAVEIRQPDYPIVALQQLARNAVMHRTFEGTNAPVRITWFNDRIEIQNPGGPFGQVNRQNFGQPAITDYRNPHLAEAMKNLGYVQRFGVGIQLARQQLQKNGNPPLEFVVEDSYVLAMLRRRP